MKVLDAMKLPESTHKLVFGFCVLVVPGLFIPQTAFCQTEKLGIVKYTPPPGWNKTQKENVIAFSSLNQTTGGFCIITVYGATPSAGNPQSDFTKEWNNLVVQPLKAEANPKTETEAENGWTAIAGGGAVEFQGNKALALLTVFSGFGKTVSVLGVLNDQAYLPQLQAFVAGIEMDKTAAASPATIQNNPATIQSGQPGKFGAMTYSAPAGWSEQRFQDGVVFKPLDLPAGEQLAMQIMPPLNSSGTLEQALAQSYDEAAAMYNTTKMYIAGGGNYGKNAAQRSFNGWEYIRGKGGVQAENGTPYKTELGLELFVVKINNRFERVAILESRKNCNLSRYYSSDRISYRNSIESLLFSLQFADFNGPALRAGSAKGPGIVGVWQGISLAVGATSIGDTLGVRYKVFSPIFLSNGQAYFGPKFPSEGLYGLDTRIPPELHQRDWGTYTFSNGRGVLKMLYADIPLRMEGDKLIITPNQTDHRFFKVNPVDGATFNGTYVLSEVNGKIPSITFTSDGRFTDNGAIKVLYHEYIDCLNPALVAGSGTYEVKDYSVLFTYSDGRKIKIAFLGVDYARSNPSPATLMMSFNEDQLVRQ
ncbi:MAG TPA: hypothetical protein DCK93_15285 [Blastocatellia bacterium]|jgi:hypothetical protein|nr:hypothetical protein [Blastocatellia bacterium]HAF24245.1 hypothetical protein [Blastocatellia bacterium]